MEGEPREPSSGAEREVHSLANRKLPRAFKKIYCEGHNPPPNRVSLVKKQIRKTGSQNI